jgi:hypothetical protein
MKKSLAVLLLAAMPSSSGAATWAFIAEAKDDTRLAVDASSIILQGGLRKAWLRMSYGKPDTDGAVSSKEHYGYDCESRAEVRLAYVSYNRQGSTVRSLTTPSLLIGHETGPVTPDTIGEAAYNFVCSYPIGVDPRQIDNLKIED